MGDSKEVIGEIQRVLVSVVEDNKHLKTELELMKRLLKYAVEEIETLKTRSTSSKNANPANGDSISELKVRMQALDTGTKSLAANVESKFKSASCKWKDTESKLMKRVTQQASNVASMNNVQNSAIQNQLSKIESKIDSKMATSEKKILDLVKAEDSKLSRSIRRQEKAINEVTMINLQKSFLLKSQVKAIITEEEAMLNGSNSGTIVWKITNFRKQMTDPGDISKTIFSEPFLSNEYGYSMIVHVDFLIDRLGVFIEFLPSEFRGTLPPIFQHRRTFRMLDQSPRTNKRHIIRQQEPAFGSSMSRDWMAGNWGNPSFVTYSLLERTSDIYIKNDAIFLKVEVEPLILSWAKTLITDGLLVWRINNYQRTKEESQLKINEFLESAPFYTASGGYRMQGRLQFTIDTLNIFPDFLVGEHDAILEDAFSHQTRVFVVDQSDAGGKGVDLMQRVMLDVLTVGRQEARIKMSKGCGGVAFPYVKFEQSPYLVNDALVLKIIVDPI